MALTALLVLFLDRHEAPEGNIGRRLHWTKRGDDIMKSIRLLYTLEDLVFTSICHDVHVPDRTISTISASSRKFRSVSI